MNKISKDLLKIAREIQKVKTAGLFDIQNEKQFFSNNPTGVSKLVQIVYQVTEEGKTNYKINDLIKPIISDFDVDEFGEYMDCPFNRILVYENGDLYLDGMKQWLIYNGKINNKTKKILQKTLEEAIGLNYYYDDPQGYEQNLIEQLSYDYANQNPDCNFKTWLKREYPEYHDKLNVQEMIELYNKENTNKRFTDWLNKKFELKVRNLYVEDSKKLFNKLFLKQKYWLLFQLRDLLNVDLNKLLQMLINKSNVTSQALAVAKYIFSVKNISYETFSLIFEKHKTSKVAFYLMTIYGKNIIGEILRKDPKYFINNTNSSIYEIADWVLEVEKKHPNEVNELWGELVLKATQLKQDLRNKYPEQIKKMLSKQKLQFILDYLKKTRMQMFKYYDTIEQKIKQQFGITINIYDIRYLNNDKNKQEIINKIPRKIINKIKTLW